MKLFQLLLLTFFSFAAARLRGSRKLAQEVTPPENIVDENPKVRHRRNLMFFGENPNTGAPVTACNPATGCTQAQANNFCVSKGYAGATTWEAQPNNLGFKYINCQGTPPTPAPEVRCTDQYFGTNPTTGLPVAYCDAVMGCTEAQANAFCQSRGYDGSTTWGVHPNYNGFGYINCRKCVTVPQPEPTNPPPPPPPPQCTYQFFGANSTTGAPVANCNPATGCNQAQANSFCQSKGYDMATTWGAFPNNNAFQHINCKKCP